jgi:hypothetical protein
MKWVYLVIAIVIADLLLAIGLIWAIMRVSWRPLMMKYPAQRPTANAVTRNFQSYRFGHLNFGFSMHTTVDERHLHLTPARFLRWFGAGPISVPWESITDVRPARIGRYATARFDRMRVVGPRWCLQLAEPGETSETTPD